MRVRRAFDGAPPVEEGDLVGPEPLRGRGAASKAVLPPPMTPTRWPTAGRSRPAVDRLRR